jgi:hypothetical protein
MRSLKMFFTLTAVICLILMMFEFNIPKSFGYETTELFDDFNGTTLDSSKWLVAYKQWGRDASGNPANGGVNP